MPGTGFILSTLIIAVPGSVMPLVRARLRNSSNEITDLDWVANTYRRVLVYDGTIAHQDGHAPLEI
jgi:hypothetical protein